MPENIENSLHDLDARSKTASAAGLVEATKSILMCSPQHFDVYYEINPWMHLDDRVDRSLARDQWRRLHDLYTKGLEYEVKLIEPIPGLPDMVFTANGGLVIDGKACLSRFKYPERQHETVRFQTWFRSHGYETFEPEHEFEGEGDCLYAGGTLFAGYGFRSSKESHSELQEFFGVPLVSLRLTDPRFYHLDTAMCPLTEDTLMYYPGAFDETGRAALRSSFGCLIEASEADACAFGLNAVSDGRRVVLSGAAPGLAEDLSDHGFEPIGVDMTEFRKSGGAVKCCSLELR